MPASATEGSVWSVSLCTQLNSSGTQQLKEPRTVTMADFFVVGEVASNPDGGSGGDQNENPLG